MTPSSGMKPAKTTACSLPTKSAITPLHPVLSSRIASAVLPSAWDAPKARCNSTRRSATAASVSARRRSS